MLRRVRAHRPASFLEWAADEMRRHDVRMLTEAARSISRFDSRPWIHDVDVPTAVLRTNRDRLVDPASQTELATAIRGATVVDHDHGHFACARSTFTEPLVGRVPRRRLARQRLTHSVRSRSRGRSAG